LPHNKSTKKRAKTNEVRRQRNMARRSRMRHAIRDLRSHAATKGEGADEKLLQELKDVSSLLDRMVAKGLIHRNKAARLKSRLGDRVQG
jgi:small subunit ribosomal protein S20